MEIEKNVQNKIRVVIFGLLITFGLFVLETFSLVGWLRNGISYVFDPLAFSGESTGKSLRSYLTLFTNIKDFRDEYNALKLNNTELKVFEDYNKLLLDQNAALKKQLDLGNKKEEYILVQSVLSSDTELSLSQGADQGIANGDIVVLGNLYIGTINSVDLKGSRVRLPLSRASNLQVLIVKGKDLENVSLENIAGKYVSEKSVKAVAVGNGTEIRLENIPVNSGVKKDDSVVIADERVGEYLVLGRIESVDKDLAAATISATVNQIVEYDSLSNIFVRIQK